MKRTIFPVKLSPAERAKLTALAVKLGRTRADSIRLMIDVAMEMEPATGHMKRDKVRLSGIMEAICEVDSQLEGIMTRLTALEAKHNP